MKNVAGNIIILFFKYLNLSIQLHCHDKNSLGAELFLPKHQSLSNKKNLVDSLHKLGIKIVSVFGTEHGFRGNASAGTKVQDEVDSATGIQMISLYGPRRKLSKEDMDSIDLMI
jgi:hypothetical protein